MIFSRPLLQRKKSSAAPLSLRAVGPDWLPSPLCSVSQDVRLGSEADIRAFWGVVHLLPLTDIADEVTRGLHFDHPALRPGK